VAGLYPNGTVKWPCGSINKGEGTSGQFKMQLQQTMLASLSLGPVGISDQLSARPDNASAQITSNVSLVMATCAATGDLLQPSYPLTPTERSIISGQLGTQGAELWATFTAVPAARTGLAGIWYTALGFCLSCKGHAPTGNLTERDLAPMVDAAGLPSPSFSDVPSGSFTAAGATFAPAGDPAPTQHLWWRADVLAQQASGCDGVEPLLWNGTVPNLPLPTGDGGTLVHVAPVLGSVALLGEAGKVSAMSTYRFASVEVASSSLTVALRGKPGEKVGLLFAAPVAGGFKCVEQVQVIGSDGTATASFSAESR